MKCILLVVVILCGLACAKVGTNYPPYYYKQVQMVVSVWHLESGYEYNNWEAMNEIMDSYDAAKEAGNFTLDLLQQTLTSLFTLSRSSSQTIWADATTLRILDAAMVNQIHNKRK